MFHSYFFLKFVKNYCEMVFDVVSTIKKEQRLPIQTGSASVPHLFLYLYVSV